MNVSDNTFENNLFIILSKILQNSYETPCSWDFYFNPNEWFGKLIGAVHKKKASSLIVITRIYSVQSPHTCSSLTSLDIICTLKAFIPCDNKHSCLSVFLALTWKVKSLRKIDHSLPVPKVILIIWKHLSLLPLLVQLKISLTSGATLL